MTANLTNLKICIERPLPEEEHVMKMLSDKSNSNQHFQKLSAAFLSQKIWPKDATIKVSFIASSNNIKSVDWTPIAVLQSLRNSDGSAVPLDPIEEEIRKLSPVEAVKKVVRERIQPITGIKFIFVASGGNVRVSFDPHGGAWSLIGTDCIKSTDEATMNLGWLDAGTIMHEFGHVLGLIHEHQNPNGISIAWDDSKVYEWAKQTQGWDKQTTYHNIIERYKMDQLNASKFDPKSIMLYFFPATLTTNHKGTRANHIISPEDAIYISKVYPGGHMTASEFYKYAYNKSLTADPNGKDFPWAIIAYIFVGLLGVLILYFIVRYFYKRSGSSSYSYIEWKKAHGGSVGYTPRRYG